MRKLTVLLMVVAVTTVAAVPASADQSTAPGQLKKINRSLPQTMPAEGTLPNGGEFSGKLVDPHIVTTPQGDPAIAGTLDGVVETPADTAQVTEPITEPITDVVAQPTAGTTCKILQLQADNVFVDLLGLQIIIPNLDVTVQGATGDGKLLGNLLCGLAGVGG